MGRLGIVRNTLGKEIIGLVLNLGLDHDALFNILLLLMCVHKMVNWVMLNWEYLIRLLTEMHSLLQSDSRDVFEGLYGWCSPPVWWNSLEGCEHAIPWFLTKPKVWYLKRQVFLCKEDRDRSYILGCFYLWDSMANTASTERAEAWNFCVFI